MPLSFSLQNGDGATSNFVVPFAYLDKSHVHVFISTVENGTFTWVDSTHVQITPAPPVGVGNVEIRRTTPRDAALTDFNNGSVLFDTDLDVATLQTLYISQEYFEQAPSAFPTGHTLDSHSDATPGASVAKGTLRIYDVNSKWNGITAPGDGGLLIGDTADTKGARWFPKGLDGYVLQVLDSVAGKLAWVPGFKNLYTTLGDILYASSSGVPARLGIGTAGQTLVARPSNTPPLAWENAGFTTGDVKLSIKTSEGGWVVMNDTTIGSLSSGATGRAAADTEPLFTLLWNNTVNADCAVSGGRGGSAAVDFAANKTIALPKTLGRALACYGSGSGLSSRVMAKSVGAEDAVVVTHNHGITDPSHAHAGTLSGSGSGYADYPSNYGVSIGGYSTTGITINNAGVSGTGMNMQPTTFFNVLIKL